jgi:putative glutamine amidotransferase
MKPIIGITAERESTAPDQPGFKFQGMFTAYIEAIHEAGGLPILIPLTLTEDDLDELQSRLDGVLIPGGGDIDPTRYRASPHPQTKNIDADRDRLELNLTRQAVERGRPFFGICRGLQVFNVALGGTLYQDLPSEHPGSVTHSYPWREFPPDRIAHTVKIEEESLLARCVAGEPLIEVNSSHHQAVKDLAPGLEITARAPDGVVEALELSTHPFALAVQWHPEHLRQPEMRRLFKSFVEAAKLMGRR